MIRDMRENIIKATSNKTRVLYLQYAILLFQEVLCSLNFHLENYKYVGLIQEE
jgi:hypothetical protein